MGRKEITTKEDLMKVIELFENTGITYWLDGGWGVDILAGKQTRIHRDIDINFDAQHTEKLLNVLLNLGYKIDTDWKPVRIELYSDELGYLDIHPFVLSEDGTSKQADLEGGWYEFEKDYFGSAFFEGKTIPCISLKGQRVFHSGYELRDKDLLASLSNVVVYYDGISVCEPVSFEIRQGERIVLDGKNGSGKSSLLKLVVGQSIDYTGTVTLGSGLVISYVPQDTSYLCGTLSEFAEENNLDESLFKAILRKMDFERVQFEKDIKDFSGGQKKKVLIAKSLCEKAHLYVWDEPLNFIDVYSRMQIEQLITEFAPTMLLVEHDSVFRDTVASKIVNI